MNRRVLVYMAIVALGAGCNKKKPEEGTEPPLLPTINTEVGSGSAKPEPPKADPKLVERGEYLANVLGCKSCHVAVGATGPDFSRAFAGGLEVPEKFGTWRAPNITQHKGSGIGGWKDEEIIAAVREGVRPDGRRLFPMMPYLNYNRMTDDDAKALVAFLRTVPPIDNVVLPNNNLKLPQPPVGKPTNAPDPTGDPLKHGEYLVTLMHCAVCHTPSGKDGMPDPTKLFAGGYELEAPILGTGKLYSSNITSDPVTGIGKWTEADVAISVKTLVRPDRSIIQGPMQLYLVGWSQLKDDDLKAVATYLKQIPPIKNKVAKSAFKPNATAPGTGNAGSGNAGSGSAATGGTGSGSNTKTMATPVESAGSGSAGSGSKN